MRGHPGARAKCRGDDLPVEGHARIEGESRRTRKQFPECAQGGRRALIASPGVDPDQAAKVRLEYSLTSSFCAARKTSMIGARLTTLIANNDPIERSHAAIEARFINADFR